MAWRSRLSRRDCNKTFRHGKKGYYIIELIARPELVKVLAEIVPEVVERKFSRIKPAERGLVSASFRSVRLYCLLSDFSEFREVIEPSEKNGCGVLSDLFNAEGLILGRALMLCYAQKLLGIESTGPPPAREEGAQAREPQRHWQVYEKKETLTYLY